MTLLETTENRRIGNAVFADKHPAYRASGVSVTRELAENYDAWTMEKIGSRQRWMARQATGIWRIAFAS